jgi:signal peptidase I
MDNTPQEEPKPIGPVIVDATEATVVDNVVDQDQQQTEQRTKKEGIKSIISTIAILIIAPLIALCLTAFVFQSYEVDGPSMESTLQNHDRLIVYKLPRTIAKITRNQYQPKRGEIVIFTRKDGLEFGNSKPRQLVKRVIAVAGERVVVKDGIVTVYNKEKPEGFSPDQIAEYGKVIGQTDGIVDLVVPEGTVFVCGDNRPESLDSRAFGPVNLDDLVGRLSLRVYPFNKGQSF